MVILCKVGVGWVGGFSCTEFAEIFEIFLFVEGVIGSILGVGGGWGVGLAEGGAGGFASKVCISTFSVAQSSARMHFCSAWSSVICVPG